MEEWFSVLYTVGAQSQAFLAAYTTDRLLLRGSRCRLEPEEQLGFSTRQSHFLLETYFMPAQIILSSHVVVLETRGPKIRKICTALV